MAFPKFAYTFKGFLGLTRYYCKFIQGYGTIVMPLTKLLKNNSFHGDDIVTKAFNQLKQALANPLY